MRLLRIVLVLVLSASLVAACQKKSSDPARVSREFIVALWTADSARVRALSCAGAVWSFEGDPTMTVDAEHLRFEVTSQGKDRAEVVMSGVVTFRSAEGQFEVRDLDQVGTSRFVLVNEGGWKVCDVQ